MAPRCIFQISIGIRRRASYPRIPTQSVGTRWNGAQVPGRQQESAPTPGGLCVFGRCDCSTEYRLFKLQGSGYKPEPAGELLISDCGFRISDLFPCGWFNRPRLNRNIKGSALQIPPSTIRISQTAIHNQFSPFIPHPLLSAPCNFIQLSARSPTGVGSYQRHGNSLACTYLKPFKRYLQFAGNSLGVSFLILIVLIRNLNL